MRISVNWLRDWLEAVPAPRELASRLTMAGLEVEALEPAAPPLHGIVVGEIVEREKHPDADSLSVCRVSTGGGELLQIVCGAANARVGLKAPLATIGSQLPGGMEIRKARLRGVESFGMLCSSRELGLSEDGSGLMELPPELDAGTPLVDALGLDDTILEINLTPNRGDCMGMLGLAREVAAITDTSFAQSPVPRVPAQSSDSLPVELTPGAGCARFASRVIRGVRPEAEAPLWMRERLRRCRPASAGSDRGRHEFRDARARSAHARLRPAGNRGRHRGPPGQSGGDPPTARWTRRNSRRLGAGHRRPRQAPRARRNHGWRALRHRRRYHRRGAGGRVLSSRCNRRSRPPLRARDRRLAALRARRGSDAAGAGDRAGDRAAARLRRRRAGPDHDRGTAIGRSTTRGHRLPSGARAARDRCGHPRRGDRAHPAAARHGRADTRKRLAGDRAAVALRHLDRGGPDRGGCAGPRLRPHSRDRSSDAARHPGDQRRPRHARDHCRPARAARLLRGDHLQFRGSGAAGRPVPRRARARAGESDLG